MINRDVFWSVVEAAGSAVFSLGSAFLVARLIGPAELGIGATAVAMHVLLWVAVNSLFADAIVQRGQCDATTLSSAVWASCAVGGLGALAQAGSGWLLAWSLNDPRLCAMALVLAVPLPFVGLGGALQGKLTRERRYRTLALRTLLGQGIGMAAGIGLATLKAGAWAPVIQQACVSLISALVLMFASGWRPMAVFRWDDVRGLLRVGLPLTASTLAQIGRYRIFALLIGGMAGPTALGQIHMAFRLADSVRDILFTALWRLLLPILSEQQHDRVKLLAEVDRVGLVSGFGAMPLCGGMMIALVPLTVILLGPEWGDAGAAAVPLAGLMLLLTWTFPSGVALIALGQAQLTLYANLMGLAATVALVLIARPDQPWSAVMVWCGAQVFITPYSLWMNARALRAGPLRILRGGLPALLTTAAAVGLALMASADDPFTLLLRRGVIFAVVFIAGAVPVLWRRKSQPAAA